jgi:hypothetical protein
MEWNIFAGVFAIMMASLVTFYRSPLRPMVVRNSRQCVKIM